MHNNDSTIFEPFWYTDWQKVLNLTKLAILAILAPLWQYDSQHQTEYLYACLSKWLKFGIIIAVVVSPIPSCYMLREPRHFRFKKRPVKYNMEMSDGYQISLEVCSSRTCFSRSSAFSEINFRCFSDVDNGWFLHQKAFSPCSAAWLFGLNQGSWTTLGGRLAGGRYSSTAGGRPLCFLNE